ncbi:hypothetical protein BJV77DRAFT_1065469 [Russula vinacea]|nr:hypothetical protein BJV77DRAFT_1065469 [Russula vinacea]
MPGDPSALQCPPPRSPSPSPDPTNIIQALSEAIFTDTHEGGKVLSEPSDKVVQSLREALPTHPQEASLALAGALLTRFLVASAPSGDSADRYRAQASEMIALLALARSIIYSDPGYSEEAILRCRAALSFTSLDNHLRVVLTQALAILAEQRFKYFGLADGLQEADSLVSDIVMLLSSEEGVGGVYASKRAYSIGTVVEKIRHLEELLQGTTSESPCHRTYLEDLACWYDTKFSRTGDIPDIKMAIRYRRMLLSPNHLSHPLLFIPLTFLCDDLLIAFECTGSTDYLDESIILHRNLLSIQRAKALHFTILRRLVPSLCVRYRLLRHRQDLDEMMDLCPMAVDDKYVSFADRFKFSCLWAFLARHFGHSSVSSAYESAMSLSQASLALAPTVQVQQGRLVEMGGTCERMPLDYASYQIGSGCVEQAIEILERGRALLWSEMRGFRSSIDQPISSHLPLAEKLTSLNHELEMLTVSNTQGVYTDADDGSRVGSLEEGRMDPFCRLVTRQRRLLKERDALVSHIRSLPGLGDFLTPPSFDTLRSAASRGPVIIINHSKWRSDILILLHDSPPCRIPTPSDFYDRANRIKNQLLSARYGRVDVLSTPGHASTVRTVLADLYALVGGWSSRDCARWASRSSPGFGGVQHPHSVIFPSMLWAQSHRNAALTADPESSVTSPTSTSLPRRFANVGGPASSSTTTTTTKSSVAAPRSIPRTQSRGHAEGNQDDPGTPPRKSEKPCGKKATKAAVLEGLEQHRFAHLAGSVKLVPGRPFDAPFVLHGSDDRLTLLDIARCRLPSAEFAFLSASHTAELTEESHPDEALHLAAAMQHCGFRSVVGTMWAMADMDGRDVCKQFYKLMFEEENLSLKGRWGSRGRGRGKGKEEEREGLLGQGPEQQEQERIVPYCERAAKALRDAVQKLRKKKGITVDRWVTYVHYGA